MTMGPIERENIALRAEVEVLRETVRQFIEAGKAIERLPAGTPNLTPQEETVFRALLRSDGVVSRERLYTALYGGASDAYERIIDVILSHLRKKLGPVGYKLETSWGRGWKLIRPGDQQVNGELMPGMGVTAISTTEVRQ